MTLIDVLGFFLHVGLYSSITLLFIRNVYRFIEFSASAGDGGYLVHTEWLFYMFETLPILSSFAVYNYFHFGRLLESSGLTFPDHATQSPAPAPKEQPEPIAVNVIVQEGIYLAAVITGLMVHVQCRLISWCAVPKPESAVHVLPKIV